MRIKLSLQLFFLFSLFEYPSASHGSPQARENLKVRPENVLLNVLTQPFKPLSSANRKCQNDSAAYLTNLASYAPWALRMYDASAKLPAGVITGNYRELGNYDECLSVKTEKYQFIGQACNVHVRFNVSKIEDNGQPRDTDIGDLFLGTAVASNATHWDSGLTVRFEWLMCVPSSCTHQDVEGAYKAALIPLAIDNRVGVLLNVHETSCHTAVTDQSRFDSTDWSYITVLALFAVIVILSTSYDLLKPPDTAHRILTSFSLYTNGKNLFSTKRHRDYIDCIDGIRFLSMCWIVYGHTYYMEVTSVKLNLTQVNKMHNDWMSMFVLNGNISTDIFFLLGGTVLTYTAMLKKNSHNKEKFNILGLYLHRYLRVTPAYSIMIGFYATLLYKVGSGPYWDEIIGANKGYCRDNWWTNILYVNNYINIDRMCMGQTWYLAVDMQLYWLSPIFLYPLIKFRRSMVFWILIVSFFVMSICLPFSTTFFNHLTGTMLYYKESIDVVNVYIQIYTRMYNRAGPFIIGLGLGYLLSKTKNSTQRISPYYIGLGWLIAMVFGVTTIFGPKSMYEENYEYDRLKASLYAGLHRHSFALCISWLIYACTHGYSGPIGSFLSWRIWAPLSKLTYCIYLCHYVPILIQYGGIRTTGILTTFSVTHAYFGHMVATLFISIIWSLCFEMPFMTLDRLMISGARQRKKSQGNNNEYISNQLRAQKNEQNLSPSTSTLPMFGETKDHGPQFKTVVQRDDQIRGEFYRTRNEDEEISNPKYMASKVPYYINVIESNADISVDDITNVPTEKSTIIPETSLNSESSLGIDNYTFEITDDKRNS